MRQASEVSFRTYTLHAENSVAVTTAKVTLIRSMRCEVMPAFRRKQSTQFSPDKTLVVMHYYYFLLPNGVKCQRAKTEAKNTCWNG